MLNPCRSLLFLHCICLVLSWLLSLSFPMQCWRPCPLPPAQPSVALGSSASPLSMRSTITKLVELSIFSKVAGNKQFSSWCPSLLPPLHAFPPPHDSPLTVTLTSHTSDLCMCTVTSPGDTPECGCCVSCFFCLFQNNSPSPHVCSYFLPYWPS